MLFFLDSSPTCMVGRGTARHLFSIILSRKLLAQTVLITCVEVWLEKISDDSETHPPCTTSWSRMQGTCSQTLLGSFCAFTLHLIFKPLPDSNL